VGILSSLKNLFGFQQQAEPSSPDRERVGAWRQPPALSSRELLDLYERNDELRKVVDLIAVRSASVKWKVFKNGKEVDSKSDSLVRAWAKPNPYMSGRSMRALLEKWLRIQDEAFIRPVVVSSSEVELYPIPPHWVTVEGRTDGSQQFRVRYPVSGTEEVYGEHEMLWLRIHSVSDPYGRAVGTGLSAADDAEKAEYAGKFVKAYFYNDATPGLVIHAPGMPETMRARFEAGFRNKHQGVEKSHGVHVVGGPDQSRMSFHQLTPAMKDLTITEIEKRSGDAIRQLYGISPELVGDIEKSNRATIKEALAILAELVLNPRLSFLEEEINERLLPMITSLGLNLQGYEMGYVDPTPKDSKAQQELMKVHPHHFTRNEIRAAAGLPPVQGGDDIAIARGNVQILPMGAVIDDSKTFALPKGSKVRLRLIRGAA